MGGGGEIITGCGSWGGGKIVAGHGWLLWWQQNYGWSWMVA